MSKSDFGRSFCFIDITLKGVDQIDRKNES